MKSAIIQLIKVSIILLFVLFIDTTIINAQDQLFLLGHKEVVLIKLLEIKKKEIEFKYWPVLENSEIRVVRKDSINKVILESGSVFLFNDEIEPKQAFNFNQKRTAMKIQFE
jgi:hypothetical protein